MSTENIFAVTCKDCGMFVFLPENNFTCQKCKLIRALEEKIQSLEERITMLQKTKEGKEEKWEVPIGQGSSQLQEVDARKNVTHRSKKMDRAECLELKNQYAVLSSIDENEEQVPEQQGKAPASYKKRRVVVIGDSLLRGMESVICRPDRMAREVCCLPGAKIQHITERMERLIKPTDHYPFLLIHMGTNDTAKHSIQETTRVYEALGSKLKDLQA